MEEQHNLTKKDKFGVKEAIAVTKTITKDIEAKDSSMILAFKGLGKGNNNFIRNVKLSDNNVYPF